MLKKLGKKGNYRSHRDKGIERKKECERMNK